MKKIIKLFSNGIVIGLGFLFVIGISYIIIKARSTTNPGLTEQAPTGGLYVNSNETLNAAKRNALVSKINELSGVWTDCNTSCAIATPSQWKFFSGRSNGYTKIGKTVCFNFDLYDVNGGSTNRTLGWGTTMISGLPPAKKLTLGGTAVASVGNANYSCGYAIDTSGQYSVYCWNVAVVGLNSSGCYEAQ